MIEVLIISAVVVAVLIGVAMLLPCEACRMRRERMRAAYARWRELHPDQKP